MNIIIHCRNFSAARPALRDNQGNLPDFKVLLRAPTDLQKVTHWVTNYAKAKGAKTLSYLTA